MSAGTLGDGVTDVVSFVIWVQEIHSVPLSERTGLLTGLLKINTAGKYTLYLLLVILCVLWYSISIIFSLVFGHT